MFSVPKCLDCKHNHLKLKLFLPTYNKDIAMFRYLTSSSIDSTYGGDGFVLFNSSLSPKTALRTHTQASKKRILTHNHLHNTYRHQFYQYGTA
jgi:hypothetical protein